MPEQNRKVRPGFRIGTVITDTGEVLTPPADWAFLAAGDAPLTREVKKRGPSWQVQVERGRRVISKGIWTAERHISEVKAELEAKRATPEYARKKEAEQRRKSRKHQEYVDEFHQQTVRFLNFHPAHRELAEKMARAVTEHTTPVGSGTVARTERISVDKRVEAAVIAWMRHQTTAYDSMRIPRIKGKRREVRRMLAERSKALLDGYRRGETEGASCPLYIALLKSDKRP